MTSKTIVAVLGLFLAAQNVRPQTPKSEEEVGQLLAKTRSTASLLRSDVSTLDLFTTEVDFRANSAVLQVYEGHIRDLRDQAAQLQAMRQQASSAQQTAIDRIVPVVQDYARSAEAAVGAAKTGAGRSDLQPYLKLHTSLAAEFSTIVAAWTDYAETKAALDRIHDR